MNVFINAGFGNAITRREASLFRANLIDGIRFDALYYGPHEVPPQEVPLDVVKQTIDVCGQYGLQAMPLLSRPLRTGPIDPDFAAARAHDIVAYRPEVIHRLNVGKEYNDSKDTRPHEEPVALIRRVKEAVPFTPITACLTNNMGKAALAYTEACIRAGLRCHALGPHWYHTTVPAHLPALGSGWRSLNDQWEAWRELCMRYNFALESPEGGYHTAISSVPVDGWLGKLGVKKDLQFGEQRVAEFIRYELETQRDYGCELCGIFQVRDATNPDPRAHEQNYGLWSADLTRAKPAVEEVRRFQEGERR